MVLLRKMFPQKTYLNSAVYRNVRFTWREIVVIATVISVIALFFSAISLGFTIYNILRDRGKINVWSEIYFDSSKSFENPPPALKIRIVNSGRRPIIIVKIVKKSEKSEWSTSIVNPSLPKDENGFLLEAPTPKDFLAQNTCLVLREGEVHEWIIDYEEHLSNLIHLHDDEVHFASKLYIEDVLKKRYYVKDSLQNIKRLCEHKEET